MGGFAQNEKVRLGEWFSKGFAKTQKPTIILLILAPRYLFFGSTPSKNKFNKKSRKCILYIDYCRLYIDYCRLYIDYCRLLW